VKQAVVMVRDDEAGRTRLVAYFVPTPGHPLDSSVLREHLLQKVPDYMLPSGFVALSAFPRTPCGKLDRKALPTPDPEVEDRISRPPSTPEEQILCDLFAEVLGLGRVGVDDNFFFRGGHSLSAMRLTGRIRAVLGVELTIKDFFDTPTVSGLQDKLREAKKVSRPGLRRRRPIAATMEAQ
jgi:aryl carrier-like protein